ncbi:MAG TPA: rhodanese-like domain-containing protein [Candidatus Bathyarchaeia archaeon]|nr:rhodanese-like domain-containing protein [Candidatus Bathyarchaeia archaeon]
MKACVCVCAVLMSVLFFMFAAPRIAWAESPQEPDTTHYSVVDVYKYPGFNLVQFTLPVLSHYSYMVVSGKESLMVDPGRDIFAYLDYAKKEGLSFKGTFLTHSHADFVAGHMEMAKATGSPIYASAISEAEYPFKPLEDGTVIEIGEATVKAVATPGHTPDSMTAYVFSKDKPDMPELVLTGDMLFVGSIGRPDLLGGTMTGSELAGMSFDTWVNKLAKLGDAVVVFPAHGAGSLCGANLSDAPSSTIGAERAKNPYLQHKGRNEYIAADLAGLPEAPQYFHHDAALNRNGPDLVDWSAPMPKEDPADVNLTDPAKAYVVDLRSDADYAIGHIPSSVNIGLTERLETWVGIMVPWNARLVVCGTAPQMKEAIYRLHRVGYHAGVVSIDSWLKSSQPVAKNTLVKPADLNAQVEKADAPIILDVRLAAELSKGRIAASLNLPLQHLDTLSAQIDPAQPVVTLCNSGYRSSMAVGVLERKGFKNVASLLGGMTAWTDAALPTAFDTAASYPVALAPQTAQFSASATPPPPRVAVNLPERISASDLKRMIVDLPGTFEFVDIRPPAMFADYTLPGARNVDIGDLITNSEYLNGTTPLVIVDRDGSLAMAAAGILSQKTTRPIRALYGGLEAYWAASELNPVVKEVALGASAAAAGSSMPQAAPPAPPASAPASQAPAAPQPAKKKSAGC